VLGVRHLASRIGLAVYAHACRTTRVLPLAKREALQASLLTRKLPPRRDRIDYTVDSLNGVRSVWLGRERLSSGLLVYLHGGAYATGPNAGQWRWLSTVTSAAGMAGVLVDYRLSRDAPYPAATEDIVYALGALHKQHHLDHGWVLAGDSAGGGLALGIAQRVVRDPPLAAGLRGLVLMSPWVDLLLRRSAMGHLEALDPILQPAALERAARRYAGGVSLSAPELSPINAELGDLPATHLTVGTRDVLLADARRLHRGLVAASVPVEYYEQSGALHVFPMIAWAPGAAACLARQVSFLRRSMAGPAVAS
jgi:acetyl esterase/lipase